MMLKLGRVDGIVSGVVDPYASRPGRCSNRRRQTGHTLAGI